MGEGIYLYGLGARKRRYTRDLQTFAKRVIARGRRNGSYYNFGKTNEVYLNDLRRRGIEIKSENAAITDKTILKYPKHPKKKKGATLNINRFVMLEAAIKHPKNVYVDTHRNRLVYVGAVRYSDEKVLKAIMEPNQRIGKKYFNEVVSYGVVNKIDMRSEQYAKIK